MALELSVTKYGIEFPKAYAKITYYEGDNESATMNVLIWANEIARQAGEEPIERIGNQRIVIDDTTMSLFPTLYTKLKELDYFKGASDV